jgi:anti-anti-sigma factor
MSNIKCAVKRDVLVVSFVLKNLSQIEDVVATGAQLLAMTCQASSHRMMLDFRGVQFMNSSMVGQLFVLSKRCRNDGISLRICHLNPTIRQVLEIVGLQNLIRLIGDDEDPFEAFESSDSSVTKLKSRDSAEIDALAKLAESGDADAMVELGKCHEEGSSVQQDMDEAFRWYRQAADLGHAEGQHKTGLDYAYGIGVDPDWSKAMAWYRKAAEQGHAEAEYAVGMIYCYGLAGESDKAQAIYWYQRALSNGYERARLELARLQ